MCSKGGGGSLSSQCSTRRETLVLAGAGISLGAKGGAEKSAETYRLALGSPSSRFLSDTSVSMAPSKSRKAISRGEIFGWKHVYTRAKRCHICYNYVKICQ